MSATQSWSPTATDKPTPTEEEQMAKTEQTPEAEKPNAALDKLKEQLIAAGLKEVPPKNFGTLASIVKRTAKEPELALTVGVLQNNEKGIFCLEKNKAGHSGQFVLLD